MSSAKNILKVLVGIVIFIIGIVWYTGVPGLLSGFLSEFLILLEGTIGLFLLFVGLIIAWMGYDDYKMDIEMSKEETTKEETIQGEPKQPQSN